MQKSGRTETTNGYRVCILGSHQVAIIMIVTDLES